MKYVPNIKDGVYLGIIWKDNDITYSEMSIEQKVIYDRLSKIFTSAIHNNPWSGPKTPLPQTAKVSEEYPHLYEIPIGEDKIVYAPAGFTELVYEPTTPRLTITLLKEIPEDAELIEDSYDIYRVSDKVYLMDTDDGILMINDEGDSDYDIDVAVLIDKVDVYNKYIDILLDLDLSKEFSENDDIRKMPNIFTGKVFTENEYSNITIEISQAARLSSERRVLKEVE